MATLPVGRSVGASLSRGQHFAGAGCSLPVWEPLSQVVASHRASTCGCLAGRTKLPSCSRCNCRGGTANSASDRGRARAEFPLLLSTLAIRPIDPATDEDARASSSSPSASSWLACESSSCRLAVSCLAFATARRRPRSADETIDYAPELRGCLPRRNC